MASRPFQGIVTKKTQRVGCRSSGAWVLAGAQPGVQSAAGRAGPLARQEGFRARKIERLICLETQG